MVDSIYIGSGSADVCEGSKGEKDLYRLSINVPNSISLTEVTYPWKYSIKGQLGGGGLNKFSTFIIFYVNIILFRWS